MYFTFTLRYWGELALFFHLCVTFAWSVSFKFYDQNFVFFFFYSCTCAACSVQLILLDMIILIIYGDKVGMHTMKLVAAILYSSHLLLPPSLSPNIVLSSLFPDTLSLCYWQCYDLLNLSTSQIRHVGVKIPLCVENESVSSAFVVGVIICDDKVGSRIVGSQGAPYVVQDPGLSLGNQILHGMSCYLVESKMCNWFLYTKMQNTLLGNWKRLQLEWE